MPNVTPIFQKYLPFLFKAQPVQSQKLRPSRLNQTNVDNIHPSLQLAYFLESNVSIFADIVLTLKQEVFRRGTVWVPRFAMKCEDCGTEYNEKKEICDCGSMNLREPNRQQINLFKRLDGKTFMETANQNDQSLEQVGSEMLRHMIVADNGYLLCIKNYAYINLEGIETLVATPLEFIALDPREVKPIQQENGLLGGKVWTCILHREIVEDKPGTCKLCGHDLQEAYYETTGLNNSKTYYLKDEVLHVAVYYPTIYGGYPPILRMIYDAYAYHYMELRTYNYHRKGRPPGFLAFPTNNLESLNAQWEALLTKAQEDPDNVQALSYDPGQGKGIATFIQLMKDPGSEMLEVKKDLRERMGSMFGVSLIFQADTSTSGGLNNEGLQITVTNRAVEFLQNPWNGREQNNYRGGIYDWIVGQFGVTDFVLQLNPSEEQDEMAEKQQFAQDAQNAKLMLDMGFDVKFENNKFIFSGQAKKPEPPTPAMPGLPTPAPQEPQVSGAPTDMHKEFDPNEPRDKDGKWTTGAGSPKKPEWADKVAEIVKSDPDEFDEYQGDHLIKDFASDALKTIKQGALYPFYSDVPESAVPAIHNIIKNAFLSHNISLKDMVEKIMKLGLDEEKARMIARTESTGVAMKAREIGWRRMEQEQGEVFKYKAVITNDYRTSPISKRIKAAVDREGGAVTLDRLKEIYREESTKPYIKGDPDNSGMGASWTGWDNFVGHPYERDSIVRVVS